MKLFSRRCFNNFLNYLGKEAFIHKPLAWRRVAGLFLATSGFLEVKYPSLSRSETSFGFPKKKTQKNNRPILYFIAIKNHIKWCSNRILCSRYSLSQTPGRSNGSNAEYRLKRQKKRLFCFSVSNSPFKRQSFRSFESTFFSLSLSLSCLS